MVSWLNNFYPEPAANKHKIVITPTGPRAMMSLAPYNVSLGPSCVSYGTFISHATASVLVLMFTWSRLKLDSPQGLTISHFCMWSFWRLFLLWDERFMEKSYKLHTYWFKEIICTFFYCLNLFRYKINSVLFSDRTSQSKTLLIVLIFK